MKTVLWIGGSARRMKTLDHWLRLFEKEMHNKFVWILRISSNCLHYRADHLKSVDMANRVFTVLVSL